jgi:hypothetical protein
MTNVPGNRAIKIVRLSKNNDTCQVPALQTYLIILASAPWAWEARDGSDAVLPEEIMQFGLAVRHVASTCSGAASVFPVGSAPRGCRCLRPATA